MSKFNFQQPRLIFIYLFLTGIVYFGLSGKQVLKDAEIATLNRIRPESFQSLIDLMKKKKPIPEKDLTEYIFYYQKVAQYIVPSSDIFGMLGFCYSAHGEKTKAIEAYKRAIELDTHFFRNYHNLGIIYFKDKQYAQAVSYFQLAAKADVNKSAKAVLSSIRIYMPLIYNGQEPLTQWLERKLRDAYSQNELLLRVAIYRQQRMVQEDMERLTRIVEQDTQLMPEVF